MRNIALKLVQRAVLATAFVSTAAIAEPVSHDYITVTPKQENVWGARLDVPNQPAQATVTKYVWGAKIDVPAAQPSIAQAPAVPTHN